MLLANKQVAEFCGHHKVNGRAVRRTMVYRVHDVPNEEKLEKFRTFVLRFGYVFKADKGRAVAKEMNKAAGTGQRTHRGERHFEPRRTCDVQGFLLDR